MNNLLFGNEQSEHLAIRFTYPVPVEQSWLEGEVLIAVEAFQGSIRILFELADLLQFERELGKVYETLNGRADFKHRDGQLAFSVIGNGRGGVEISGCAYARPTWGNKLEFEISLDQTFLAEPLAVLHALAQEEVEVRA